MSFFRMRQTMTVTGRVRERIIELCNWHIVADFFRGAAQKAQPTNKVQYYLFQLTLRFLV